MNSARVLLGACTVVAVALAVGLGCAVIPSPELHTDVLGGGTCGTYPADATTASAWFRSSFENRSDRAVRVRSVRVDELHHVSLSHLAIAPHASESTPAGLIVSDDARPPGGYGRLVAADRGYTVPAHRSLDVVGRIVLDEGRTAGRATGITVTTEGIFGTLHTVTDPSSSGIGIGDDVRPSDIGCDVP